VQISITIGLAWITNWQRR